MLKHESFVTLSKNMLEGYISDPQARMFNILDHHTHHATIQLRRTQTVGQRKSVRDHHDLVKTLLSSKGNCSVTSQRFSNFWRQPRHALGTFERLMPLVPALKWVDGVSVVFAWSW
jgi:hypothetical protein